MGELPTDMGQEDTLLVLPQAPPNSPEKLVAVPAKSAGTDGSAVTGTVAPNASAAHQTQVAQFLPELGHRSGRATSATGLSQRVYSVSVYS